MLRSFALLLTTSACTFGATISNTNVVLSTTSPFSEYSLTIYQDAAATDPTSIFFDRQGQNLIFRNSNADEGSEWYFANFNDVFTASTISQGAFTAFGQVDQAYNVGFGDFYFGVNTGNGFQGASPRREIFGWALLRNTAGGLQLIESTVTYDNPGIQIGTTTTVPEPTTVSLLTLAVVGVFIIRRRDRSTNPRQA